MSVSSCTCRQAACRGAVLGAMAGGVIASAFVYECLRDIANRGVNPSTPYVGLIGGVVCIMPGLSAFLGAGFGALVWHFK